MENRLGMKISALAAVAAALALTGCDRNDSTARRTDTTAPAVSTAPAPAPAPSVAATTDKVAAVVDDSALTAKVKAALLAEPGLKSLPINVETKNAAVTLSGSVDSDAARQKAKQVASSFSGVSTVVDNLTVKSS
jgi:hyperosmotically inducible periplasmic protein